MPPPLAGDNSIPTRATDSLSHKRLSLVDSELSEIGRERLFCKKTGGGGQGDTKLTPTPLLDVSNGICQRIFTI